MSTKKLKKTKAQTQLNGNWKYNRKFSEAFKKKKVKEIISKRLRVVQVSDLYDVTRAAVYKWVYKYSHLEKGTKQVIEMESESLKTKLLLERVAELERIIWQKQLQIDFNNQNSKPVFSELMNPERVLLSKDHYYYV